MEQQVDPQNIPLPQPQETGVVPSDVQGMVEGLQSTASVDTIKNPTTVPNNAVGNLLPTLGNYRGTNANPNSSTLYPEDKVLTNAIDSASIVKSKLSNLGQMSAEERALTGAYHGGDVGGKLGPHEGIFGAAIGAVAGRAAGMVQSGEFEDQNRRAKVNDAFKTLGIVGDDYTLSFDDGVSFKLDPNASFKNVSPITGKPTRGMYEVDKTHPFTNRTTTVAKPIAYHIAQGMLGYNNPSNEKDKKTLENTTNMIVNALQSDSDDVTKVYQRAQSLAKKMGMSRSSMEALFAQQANTMPDDEAKRLKQGLDMLFAGDLK